MVSSMALGKRRRNRGTDNDDSSVRAPFAEAGNSLGHVKGWRLSRASSCGVEDGSDSGTPDGRPSYERLSPKRVAGASLSIGSGNSAFVPIEGPLQVYSSSSAQRPLSVPAPGSSSSELSHFQTLPRDLVEKILINLGDIASLCKCAKICRSWRAAVRSTASIWQSINLTPYSEKLSDTNLKKLFDFLKELKGTGIATFSVANCKTITHAGLRPLAQFNKSLTSLNLAMNTVSEDTMNLVGQLSNLNSINLANCGALSSTHLRPLALLSSTLTNLTLSGTHITDGSLMLLRQLTNLTQLNIADCPYLKDAAFFHELTTLTNLRELTVGSDYVNADYLAPVVKKCTKLTVLQITNTAAEPGALLSTLTHLTSLQYLHVAYGKDTVNDGGPIQAIRHLTALRGLCLKNKHSRILQHLDFVSTLSSLQGLALKGYFFGSLPANMDSLGILSSITRLEIELVSGISVPNLLRGLDNLDYLRLDCRSVQLGADFPILPKLRTFQLWLSRLPSNLNDLATALAKFPMLKKLKVRVWKIAGFCVRGLCTLSGLDAFELRLHDGSTSGDDLSALWCGLTQAKIQVFKEDTLANEWASSGRSHIQDDVEIVG
eukprot:tig00000147_g9459.t1